MKLAEAIPADKYTWRPAPEVRSISEVFMHVAGSNYFIESITEKQRVVAELKGSFEHLRKAAVATKESELEKPVSMFGNATTERGVLVTVLSHLHEHLGQSIAYARMNGVKPPWSE